MSIGPGANLGGGLMAAGSGGGARQYSIATDPAVVRPTCGVIGVGRGGGSGIVLPLPGIGGPGGGGQGNGGNGGGNGNGGSGGGTGGGSGGGSGGGPGFHCTSCGCNGGGGGNGSGGDGSGADGGGDQVWPDLIPFFSSDSTPIYPLCPPPPGGPVPDPIPGPSAAWWTQAAVWDQSAEKVSGLLILCSESGASYVSTCNWINFYTTDSGLHTFSTPGGGGTQCLTPYNSYTYPAASKQGNVHTQVTISSNHP
jgi:hypothetical protein